MKHENGNKIETVEVMAQFIYFLTHPLMIQTHFCLTAFH